MALAILILFLPALLLIGFFLRANSDEPVLLTDEVPATGGTRVSIHRFRTRAGEPAPFVQLAAFFV